MAITFSVLTGGARTEDYIAAGKMAEAYFRSASDPEQLAGNQITIEMVTQTFPLSANIIKDNETVIGSTFILPCDQYGMKSFISGQTNERELFSHIISHARDASECLYLVSAYILGPHRGRGIATQAVIEHINAYMVPLPHPILFAWPWSDEGSMLAQRIRAKTGLEMHLR
ncbi:MAG: hypothetical protein ABIH41_06050 [Nanoarchaeota archaeon]